MVLTPCGSCLCNGWVFFKHHHRKTLKYIRSTLFLVHTSDSSLILHLELFHYTSHSFLCLHLSTIVHTFPKGRGSWCLIKFHRTKRQDLTVIYNVSCPFTSDSLPSKIEVDVSSLQLKLISHRSWTCFQGARLIGRKKVNSLWKYEEDWFQDSFSLRWHLGGNYKC